MPYLNEKPDFLNKTTPEPKPSKPAMPEKHDPFTDPHPSKSALEHALAKDPDVIKQASYESKRANELAKELLERFDHLSSREIEKQLIYGDPADMRKEAQKDAGDPKRFEKMERRRKENELLKKKFKV